MGLAQHLRYARIFASNALRWAASKVDPGPRPTIDRRSLDDLEREELEERVAAKEERTQFNPTAAPSFATLNEEELDAAMHGQPVVLSERAQRMVDETSVHVPRPPPRLPPPLKGSLQERFQSRRVR